MKNYFLLGCFITILFSCKKETVSTNPTTTPTTNSSIPKIKTITTVGYEYKKSVNSNDTVCLPTGETSTTNFEYDTKGRITKINTVIDFENTSSINTLTFNYTSSSTVLLQCYVDNIHYYDSQLTLDERGYVKYLKTDVLSKKVIEYDTIYYDVDGILLLGGKSSNSNSISNGNLNQFKLGNNFGDNYICEFDITKSAKFNDIGIFPFLEISEKVIETPLYFKYKVLHSLFDLNGSKIKDYSDFKNFIWATGLFGKPNKNLLINVENQEIRNESICEFDAKERIIKRTITTFGLLTGKLKRNKEIMTYSYTD